nr:unnamed protein product [uncultured bacterium]
MNTNLIKEGSAKSALRLRKLASLMLVVVLLPLCGVANASPVLPEPSAPLSELYSTSKFFATSPVVGASELEEKIVRAEITTDPVIISARTERLRQSKALVAFLSLQLDDVNEGLESIAMIATDEGIDALISNTVGMKFILTSSGVALVPENTRVRSRRDVPTCWKGWLAAYTYFAASGMVCGPLHIAGGVPGFICDGVFFTIGLLPDFNAPCK